MWVSHAYNPNRATCAQREQLNSFCSKGVPITLKDCEIQNNKFKDKLEVIVKGYTKIEASETEFEHPVDMKTVGTELIKPSELKMKE